MKKFLGSLAVAALVVSVATTSSFADPAKGQKLYLKKFKESCGMTGAVFAAKHTQADWKKINDGGKIADEIKALCPNVKEVDAKYVPDLFDFFHNFASDSGNVPSC